MNNVQRLAIFAAVVLAAACATAGSFQQYAERQVEAALKDGLTPLDEQHLVLAFLWRAELPDRTWLVGALDRLTAARPMDPLMADEVRSIRARIAVGNGHWDQARELFQTMGGLTRWWVLGPRPLGELADFAKSARLPGPEAHWRFAPGTDPFGWVRLAGLAWPTDRQTVFLATTVVSDHRQPVAIRLGVAEVARVWLNGQQLLTTEEPLARGEDNATTGAWLERGPNLLVVAIGCERGGWWARVRLTAPDGSPLSGVHETDAAPARHPAADLAPPAVRSLGGVIDAALRAGTPGALMAKAAFVVSHRPDPVDSGTARQACRAARADDPVGARILEALVNDEPGSTYTLMTKVLTLDPGLAGARLVLAHWYHEHDLDEAAHEVLVAGGDAPALKAADLDMAAQRWGPVMLPQLEDVATTNPRCLDAVLQWTARELDAGRYTDADRGLKILSSLAPGVVETINLEHKRATTFGDTAMLDRITKLSLALDPNRPDSRIQRARLLVAQGHVSRAASILNEGLERCPDQVDLLAEAMRLEHFRGHDVRAKKLVARLLTLRPQDRNAQRFQKLLGAAREDDTWRRRPTELRRMAAPLKGDEAITVLEHHEIRFLPGHLTEQRVQRVIRVGDPKRSDTLREMTIAYVPERERLRVLAARVLQANGGEVSANQSDSPRLADPAINMYYDSRLRVLDYPKLRRGDLIELTYILSETAESNETGPYTGGIVMIPNDHPVARAEIELSAPEGSIPSWELANLTGHPVKTEGPGQTVHLLWTWTNLPEAPADIPAPPPMLSIPYLAYSNHPTWGTLGGWYARHVAPRIRPSKLVADRARTLTRGLTTRRARIAALYHFVTDKIRYVALEFGEHRYRPFSADWVLSHKMGDCKDKACLLVALCHSIGIRADMVLVRTADLGPVRAQLAVLGDFDHAIAYLPDDHLWLDGTATGYDPFRPPGLDQGAFVLVVRGASSAPETTPIVGAGVSRTQIELAPGTAGTLDVSVSIKTTGDAAAALRSKFGGSRERVRFARWLQGLFPGANLTGKPDVAISPGHDPASMKLSGTVPRSSLVGDGGISVFPGKLTLLPRLAPAQTRRTPLLVPLRPDLEWTTTVDLRRTPATLPAPVAVSGPFGTLHVTIDPLPTGYRISGSFHLTPGLLPIDRIAAFRAFLLQAQRTFSRRLEVP